MSVLFDTGSRVAPGLVLFSQRVRMVGDGDGAPPGADDGTSGIAESGGDAVFIAGDGCYVRFVTEVVGNSASAAVLRQIVAARLGLAQWSGTTCVVLSPSEHTLLHQSVGGIKAPEEGTGAAHGLSVGSSAMIQAKAAARGPRAGDMVHLRITRVTRLFAHGEIIAVGGTWVSSNTSVATATSSAFATRAMAQSSSYTTGAPGAVGFRGVLRSEDIRQFRPTNDNLTAPPPRDSFVPGDVVLATVISQSDARQCQLTTIPDECGVVHAIKQAPKKFAWSTNSSAGSGSGTRLVSVAGRRDVLMDPTTGALEKRWAPATPLARRSRE